MRRSSWFRLLPIAVLAASSILLSACASGPPVRVSNGSGETVYETNRMRLSDLEFSSGLTSGPIFYAQVQGVCRGAGCTPSSYRLHVTVSSASPIQISSNRLSITADDQRYVWKASTSVQPGETFRIQNTVTVVPLSHDRLTRMAEASAVSGSIGGQSFTLADREPIKALVRTLRSVSDSPKSASPESGPPKSGSRSSGDSSSRD